MQLRKYVVLPPEITPFERRFLARLNKIALVFFYLHIPVLMAVAWIAGTGVASALMLSLAVIAGPTIAFRAIRNPRWLSVVYGITAMLMGGLLVHFGQGPVQIEMHFYFFALLAMLCMFANPTVNLAAALTVALHHLIVWLLLPSSVFNYDAQWWVVLVHAGFVVLETVAACFISRQFFDNVIGLEKIVEARTATIREQQRDMRLILNNLQEGLITIDLDGGMSTQTSRAVQEWFGTPAEGEKLSSWLGQRDTHFAEWFELGLESVKDGMLPGEVALSQLPSRLKDGGKTYSVRYQPIAGGGEGPPEKILVIFTDITELLRREAGERHQGELLRLFQNITRDKAGFLEFLAEADGIVAALGSGDYDSPDHMKRLLHTLKGNSAIFGMQSIPEICHRIEDDLAEQGEGAAIGTLLAGLLQSWGQIRSEIDNLTGGYGQTCIEVEPSEFEASLRALQEGVAPTTVARMIGSWKLEPTGKRLARIESQIRGIAERMGKSNVSVSIEPNDLRFDSERFAPFWSAFIHILRNAVDHGVEDREERLRNGKLEQSHIRVATAIEDGRFVVTVEDDGPGVDWELLRKKAAGLGGTHEEEVGLLCLLGLSSKAEVTEMSGRGMGMGAVREACELLGGEITVDSRRSAGTRLGFSFPMDQAVYEGHATILVAELGG